MIFFCEEVEILCDDEKIHFLNKVYEFIILEFIIFCKLKKYKYTYISNLKF